MSTRKTVTNNGFLLFKDQLPILENIPNENLGEAIKLLLENFDDMQKIEVNPLTNMAYELIATNIRRYREQSNKAREDGLRGGNPILKGTVKGTVKGTHKQQDKTIQNKTIQDNNLIIKKEERELEQEPKKKIDPYFNPNVNYFSKVYEEVFGTKPFLFKSHLEKLAELENDIGEDFRETIPEAIEKLKNTEFDLPNFTATYTWLLKDDNYAKVLSGAYVKKKTAWDIECENYEVDEYGN